MLCVKLVAENVRPRYNKKEVFVMKFAFKKLKAFYVYDLLLRTNEPLTLTEINKKLRTEYGIDETEKTQREFLHSMMDADVIKGAEKKRRDHLKGKNEDHVEDETTYYIGYELKERPLKDNELLWLIDNVRFSKQLSEDRSEQMVSRLLELGSDAMRNKVKSEMKSRRGFYADNDRFFDNLQELSTAIKDTKSIRFVLLNYAGTTPKLLPVQDEPLYVKPMATVVVNDFHYLIAFDPESNALQHYRVDRMRDITIAEENIPYDVRGNRLTVDDYLWTHSLMRTGKKETIKVRLPDDKLDLAIDRFGVACRFFDYGDDDDMIVTLQSNAEDLYVWALENSEFVEVLEPQSVRELIRKTSDHLHHKYLKSDEDRYWDAIRVATDGRQKSLRCDRDLFVKRKEWLHIDGLQKLHIRKCGFSDLSCLKVFTELRELEIAEKAVCDISFVKNMPELRIVDLTGTRVEDISPLAHSRVRSLLLVGNMCVKDYSVLYQLPDLEFLHIDEKVAEQIDMEKLTEQNKSIRIRVEKL